MRPGDIVLVDMPQAQGPEKCRPALYLVELPGLYQSILLCGISTQLHAAAFNWDEIIQPGDSDFANSGLVCASAILLSYLDVVEPVDIIGNIGDIDPTRLQRLRQRLSDHLRP
jgi:mRNA interferase MazF